MDDITNADSVHTERVCKDFEIKNLEYYDFYVQSDTLLINLEKFVLKYMSLILKNFF